MQKTVQISVRLPVEIRSGDGRIVTSCFLLDIPQEGLNKPEALNALTVAARCFLKSCFNSRGVDRMLYDHELRPQDVPNSGIDGRYIEVSLTLAASTPEV